MAEAGEHEEIVVEEDSTDCDIAFFRLIYLNLLLIGLPGMSL